MIKEQTFTGISHRDAMDRVRRQFGDDAIILSARQIDGTGVNSAYEIIARGDTNWTSIKKTKPKNIEVIQKRLKQEMEKRKRSKNNSEKLKTNFCLISDDEVYLKFPPEPYEEKNNDSNVTYGKNLKIKRYKESKNNIQTSKEISGSVQRKESKDSEEESVSNIVLKKFNHIQRDNAKKLDSLFESISNIDSKLIEFVRKISIVENNQKKKFSPEIENIREFLKNKGIEEDIVQEMLHRLDKHIKKEKIISKEEINDCLYKELIGSVSAAEFTLKGGSNIPTVLVILGPGGGGKTTTIVKLARLLKKDYGKKVAIATIDYKKVGAKEQIVKYSKVLGIPLKYITRPADTIKSIESLDDREIILFDTPGLNLKCKNSDIEEINRYLKLIKNPSKNLLIMPSTWKTEDLRGLIKIFNKTSIDGFIFTCIEETSNLGNVFNILYKSDINGLLWTSGSSPVEAVYPMTKDEFIKKSFLGETPR